MKNTIIILTVLMTGILAQADFASENLATATANAVELSRKEINTKTDPQFLGLVFKLGKRSVAHADLYERFADYNFQTEYVINLSKATCNVTIHIFWDTLRKRNWRDTVLDTVEDRQLVMKADAASCQFSPVEN